MRSVRQLDALLPTIIRLREVVTLRSLSTVEASKLKFRVSLVAMPQSIFDSTHVMTTGFPCLGSAPPSIMVQIIPVSSIIWSSIRVIVTGKQSCALDMKVKCVQNVVHWNLSTSDIV
jgi:hypothetical protein